MSLLLNTLRQLNGIELTIITLVAYLLLYTMYDKTRKKLVPANLITVLTFSAGVDKSLVELNKVLSLSGLTVLLFTFLPIFSHHRSDLLWSAMVQLWVHTCYSLFKYYGSKNIPYVTSFTNFDSERFKKISIVLGTLGQLVLSAGYWGYITRFTLCSSGVSFGILHFYFMEIDHKMVLRVRPFAYVVFPLAILALFYGCLV